VGPDVAWNPGIAGWMFEDSRKRHLTFRNGQCLVECIVSPPDKIVEAVLRDGLYDFREWEIEPTGLK